jgi:hypothetical protein
MAVTSSCGRHTGSLGNSSHGNNALQILDAAQTSTAVITPKASSAARANAKRAKSNPWGTAPGRGHLAVSISSPACLVCHCHQRRCNKGPAAIARAAYSLDTMLHHPNPTRCAPARGLDVGRWWPGRPNWGKQFRSVHLRSSIRYLKQHRHQ